MKSEKALSAAEQIALKNRVDQDLLQVLEKSRLRGLRSYIETTIQNCNRPGVTVQYRNIIKGECAEFLLQAYLSKVQAQIPESICVKNLCINKVGSDSTTELDVTFFTPYRIYLFECKCYAGKKSITAAGTLNTPHTVFDVFKQSRLHADFLNSHIGKAHRGKINPTFSPYQMILFDGSMDFCEDQRTDSDKCIFPHLTFDTFAAWMQQEFAKLSKQSKQWDMQAIYPIIADLYKSSEVRFQRHVKEGIARNVE